jgi:hypothetical protein
MAMEAEDCSIARWQIRQASRNPVSGHIERVLSAAVAEIVPATRFILAPSPPTHAAEGREGRSPGRAGDDGLCVIQIDRKPL